MRYADYSSIFKHYEMEHLETSSRKPIGQRVDGRKWEPAPKSFGHRKDISVAGISAIASRWCETKVIMAEALPADLLAHCGSKSQITEAASSVADISIGPSWRAVFEVGWLLCESAKDKRTRTAYNKGESIESMRKDDLLSIRAIVGDEFCVTVEDGQRVYEAVKKALIRGSSIRLSFEGVRNISAAFLHSAIGQLYNGDFSEKDLKNRLDIIDISTARLLLIERTAQRAKEFFENPSRFENRES